MFNKEGDEYKSLEIGIGILLFIGIIFVILPPVKNNNKSKSAITAESAGNVTGKITTKFTKGFFQGVWETIRGK